MVPLISSATQGPLGVCQLPRFWWKTMLWSHDLLDSEYPHCSGGLDTWLVDFLVIDKDEIIDFIATQQPTYRSLEPWVAERAHSLTPDAREQFNRRIWDRKFTRGDGYGDRKIQETYTDIGFDPEQVHYESAVLLNCLQDWQLFYKRDFGTESQKLSALFPTLIPYLDWGPLGLQLLPKIWLKHLLISEADTAPADVEDSVQELEQRVIAGLNLGFAELQRYMAATSPNYLEFESWVLTQNDGDIASDLVLRLNQMVTRHRGELMHHELDAWDQAHAAIQSVDT